MSPRENIYAAAFALLATLQPGTVRTASRRLKHWDDVPASEQPALFMTQVSESAQVQTKLPAIWSLLVRVYLYANAQNDPNIIPAQTLNPLVDAIVAAMKGPPTQEEQTLGGLVTRCRIAGQIETDEGFLGDQAVVIIPIEIIAPQ